MKRYKLKIKQKICLTCNRPIEGIYHIDRDKLAIMNYNRIDAAMNLSNARLSDKVWMELDHSKLPIPDAIKKFCKTCADRFINWKWRHNWKDTHLNNDEDLSFFTKEDIVNFVAHNLTLVAKRIQLGKVPNKCHAYVPFPLNRHIWHFCSNYATGFIDDVPLCTIHQERYERVYKQKSVIDYPVQYARKLIEHMS